MRLPGRAPVAGGRRGRRSLFESGPLAALNAWRLLGFALSFAMIGAGSLLLQSRAFAVDAATVEISGLHYTTTAEVRAAIGLPEAATPNAFRLSTTQMERALRALPAVAGADVTVSLPNRLVVAVIERAPVFGIRTRDGTFVLDADGVVLDQLTTEQIGSVGLPIVDDRRVEFAPAVEVGGVLDPTDVTAIRTLGALTPATVGSSATAFTLTVDDQDGYVLAPVPASWRAVFGHYTQTLRPPDVIDRQVQCLRSLLSSGEANVEIVYLAPLDERCGTVLPDGTPGASAAPSPTR